MVERKLFGTDGIRGRSNAFPMTAEIALKVGVAAGVVFKRKMKAGERPKVIIGKDTRLSGYMIENALAAGFTSVGFDVILVGPLPTPAVAMLTRSMRLELGVMVSASHNPYEDNGIKLFGPDGFKLSDKTEAEIEAIMAGELESLFVPAAEVGQISRLESARGRYIEYVKNSFPKDLRLDGVKVVIDCANGAAYKVAPAVLWELGTEIVSLSVNPDGRNINAGAGALFPQNMCRKVVEVGADLGIALDGDADRVIISDEKGQVVDGDSIIALIALNWQKRGILKQDTVVTTVMSNMALERFLQGEGIAMERAAVGDRYVVEMMRERGFNLGGEQSGHIILGSHSTTGDGIMAALQVLSAMVATGKKASQLSGLFKPFPQVLKSVRFASKAEAKKALARDETKACVAAAEAELGAEGRVFIRTSGTEPLVRIMVEGKDNNVINKWADELAKVFGE